MCSDRSTFVQIVQDTRFKDGLYCPKCQSHRVVKYGFYKDTQKYHCKSCLGYFNDFSGTLFSHCRIKDKLLPYLDCMQRSLTLKQSEKEIGVCFVNLFYWRHKISKALAEDDSQLMSAVMCSHIYMDYSNKGQNTDLGRNPYKRGFSNTVDYCLRKKVTVYCATDTAKNDLIFHLPSTNPNINSFSEMVSKRTASSIHWVTTPGRVYEKYCKTRNLKHTEICGHGDESTPNVKEAHCKLMTLMQWLYVFKGVATKYLGNYLKWFSTLQLLFQSQTDPVFENLLSKIALY